MCCSLRVSLQMLRCPAVWGREDDYVQLHDLDYRGGANSETLHEARENYVT